jgi:hypothetical protein
MKFKLMALSGACAVLAGCSVLQPRTQQIQITCAEPDAVLDVNGVKYRGHAELDAQRNKDLELTCSKTGFHTSTRRVRTSLSGTGKADAVGGLLFYVPAIGLITPGAWNLDEASITLSMVKVAPGDVVAPEPPAPAEGDKK